MRFHSFQIHPKELETLTDVYRKYQPGQLYKFNQIDLQVMDIAKKYLKRYYLDLDETNLQYATLLRNNKAPLRLRTPCHTIVFYLDNSGYAFALHGNLSYSFEHPKHTLTVNIPMKAIN
jgi:hypothetical protein